MDVLHTLTLSAMHPLMRLLLFTFFVPLFANTSSIAQINSVYSKKGAIENIEMSSSMVLKKDSSSLFFESTPLLKDSIIWYKILFNKNCFFEFTLFPLHENDKYTFITYKTEPQHDYCNSSFDKIASLGDIKMRRKNSVNGQTDLSKSNLQFTRQIPVQANEVLCIAVKASSGPDLGHILELKTCDNYSYVIKSVKSLNTKNTNQTKQEISLQESYQSIQRKTCLKNIKRGSVDFHPSFFTTQNGEKELKTTPTKANKDTLQAIIPKTMVDTSIKTVVNETHNQHASAAYGELKALQKTDGRRFVPVHCTVTDADKGFVIDNKPKIIDEQTGKAIELKLIKKGEFEFVVEKGKTYKVECNAMGYKNYDYSINISKAIKGEANDFEIKISPLKAGDNFILKNIYFHPNTPVFKSESTKELEKLLNFMKDNLEVVVSIEGHTNSNRYINKDPRRMQMGGKWAFHGTAKKLSQYRAEEVKEFLTKKGIEANRIKTKGWGGEKEIFPDARTMEESYKNMRVEVHILKT